MSVSPRQTPAPFAFYFTPIDWGSRVQNTSEISSYLLNFIILALRDTNKCYIEIYSNANRKYMPKDMTLPQRWYQDGSKIACFEWLDPKEKKMNEFFSNVTKATYP